MQISSAEQEVTKNSTQAFYAPIHSITLLHTDTVDLVVEGVGSVPFLFIQFAAGR